MSIYVVSRITAKPGAADRLSAFCAENVVRARAMPGCIEHDFYQSASDGSFLYLEQWESGAAFDNHLGGPVVAGWSEATDGLIATITIDIIYPDRVERL